MSHELYESWLLSEQALTPTEQDDLRLHLKSCQACQKLANGWQNSRHVLVHASMAAPAPGFSLRFQHSLAERRRQKQKATTRRLLIGLILAAAVTLAGLWVYLANTVTLVNFWSNTLYSLERISVRFNQLEMLVRSWVQNLPSFNLPLLNSLPAFLPPVLILLAVCSAFTFVIILWVSIASKLTYQGVVQQ